MESHPIRVESVGDGAIEPAVVGCQGRVVQAPILQVIVCCVHVPSEMRRERITMVQDDVFLHVLLTSIHVEASYVSLKNKHGKINVR